MTLDQVAVHINCFAYFPQISGEHVAESEFVRENVAESVVESVNLGLDMLLKRIATEVGLMGSPKIRYVFVREAVRVLRKQQTVRVLTLILLTFVGLLFIQI